MKHLAVRVRVTGQDRIVTINFSIIALSSMCVLVLHIRIRIILGRRIPEPDLHQNEEPDRDHSWFKRQSFSLPGDSKVLENWTDCIRFRLAYRGRIWCVRPYVDSNLTLSRLQHIYHGQPYARVYLNPMPESTLSQVRDLGFSFCSCVEEYIYRRSALLSTRSGFRSLLVNYIWRNENGIL